jgi:hypothetical protein
MSLNCAGNHSKAYRIAREIAKATDPADIHWLMTETMNRETECIPLYSAIDPKYEENEKRLSELYDQISGALPEELRALFIECDDLGHSLNFARELASFHLGFAAATRLMGNPPSMHVMSGGVTELKAKLRGGCNL